MSVIAEPAPAIPTTVRPASKLFTIAVLTVAALVCLVWSIILPIAGILYTVDLLT